MVEQMFGGSNPSDFYKKNRFRSNRRSPALGPINNRRMAASRSHVARRYTGFHSGVWCLFHETKSWGMSFSTVKRRPLLFENRIYHCVYCSTKKKKKCVPSAWFSIYSLAEAFSIPANETKHQISTKNTVGIGFQFWKRFQWWNEWIF